MTWRKAFWGLLFVGAVVAAEGCTGFGTNCSTTADCQATNPEAVCDETLKVCFVYGGPVVTSIAPANGKTGVASDNATVVANFSTSIVDAGVTNTSFSVVGQGFNTYGGYLVTPTQATFEPSAGGLALGTDYSVSLTAAIKDGQSNTLLPFNSTFSTTDGAWGAGGTLRYPTGDWAMASNYYGALITAADIYITGTDHDFALAVGTSDAGAPPALTVYLQNTVGQEVQRPSVAVAPDGTSFATWVTSPTDGGTTGFTALARAYDPLLHQWGSTMTLAGPDPSVGFPQVVGAGFATWIQNFNGVPLVFGSYYDFGTGNWLTPGSVQTDQSLGAANISIASDFAGNVLIVWESDQSGGGPPIILAQYLSHNGLPPPVVISTAPTASSQSAFAALGVTGFGAVVWQSRTGFDADAGVPIEHVFAATFDPARNPSFSAPVQLDRAAEFAAVPEVGVAANGNAFAFWQELGQVVSASYNHATGTWSAPVVLDSDPHLLVNGPSIVVDPGGNALASWIRDTATDGYQMFGGRYTPDAGWHGQQRLTVGADPVPDNLPAMVVDGRGRGWVLQTRQPATTFYLQYIPFQ